MAVVSWESRKPGIASQVHVWIPGSTNLGASGSIAPHRSTWDGIIAVWQIHFLIEDGTAPVYHRAMK